MLHFGNVKLHGERATGKGKWGFLGGKTPHSYANVISCMTETIEQYLWHRLCREVKAASARFLVPASLSASLPGAHDHVQLLLPYGEYLWDTFNFLRFLWARELYVTPFFLPPPPPPPFATDIYFFVPFRIFLLSALLVFVNFLWSQGPVLASP